jgi:hypothetical protein
LGSAAILMSSCRVAGRRSCSSFRLWSPVLASAADYGGGGQFCPSYIWRGSPGGSVDIERCTVSPPAPLDPAIIGSVIDHQLILLGFVLLI